MKSDLTPEELGEYTVSAAGLLNKAMSIMGESEGYKSGYLPFLVNLTNVIVTDCFEVNNTIREGAGKRPLAIIPIIEDKEDIIPYEQETITNILAHGLAFWLLFQDDENDKANICNAAYEGGKERFAKAIFMDVEDIYR